MINTEELQKVLNVFKSFMIDKDEDFFDASNWKIELVPGTKAHAPFWTNGTSKVIYFDGDLKQLNLPSNNTNAIMAHEVAHVLTDADHGEPAFEKAIEDYNAACSKFGMIKTTSMNFDDAGKEADKRMFGMIRKYLGEAYARKYELLCRGKSNDPKVKIALLNRTWLVENYFKY